MDSYQATLFEFTTADEQDSLARYFHDTAHRTAT